LHEFSITQNILSIALEKAEESNATRIDKVNIVTGELSGIVDECVETYFNIIRKDTIAARARLSFRHPQTQLSCRKCDRTFSPSDRNWVCPDCSEEAVEIVSGRECYIESIEVE
jgi:hydrogenase nickel incorporation protein HypA/HybF